MVEAARQFQQTGEAIGTGEHAIGAEVCSFQNVIPKETDWRAYPARYVWDEHMPSAETDNAYAVRN